MRFDISPTSGVAYVSHAFSYYTVNLQTGALTTLATGLPYNPSNGIALLGSSSVAFGSASSTVSEEAGAVALTVTRSGVSNRPTSVTWATSTATATAGSDYTTTGGTIAFAAGETSATVYVPILRDAVNDANETFTVELSAPVSGELGAVSTTTVTITQETTWPVVLMLPIAARTYASISKFGFTAPFSVSEAATTTASLKLGTRVVGTAPKVTIKGAAVTRAKLRLTPRGKNLIKAALRRARVGRVAMTLTLRTTDTAGNVKVTARRIVVRR
jgi:hypothetical protein